MNRLHFGYKYTYNEKFYFNGMIEAAREDYNAQGGYSGITNLFELCLGFKLDKIEGKAGLIGTELNQLQEKLWQNRYIDKVFADKYGFAPTNDFGALVFLEPTSNLKVDIAIVNGEGHKSPQMDSTFRLAVGGTYSISSNIVCRLYADVVPQEVNQFNAIAILGYSDSTLSIGAEWNSQTNRNMISNLNYGGISLYGSYAIAPQIKLLGRFDYVNVNYEDNAIPIIAGADGQLLILGAEYKLHSNILFALSSRNWIDDNTDETNSYIFFDVAIAF